MAQPTPEDTIWLTLAEASARVSFTERSLRRFISEGSLPAYRVGSRHIRIKQSDLDALLRPIPTAAG
ncbi:excisionase family DNA binding protein [Mumia flava]|uniref:Excisionase family DNA binding protein n=1 Tax=Mumia flava TaxID=1348852 RepID=A0A0B2BNM9_9ACTN|nr:helix-turn-helix domain-containing protein [Mumia flava]PJJ48310.1 excisionase family DNA binding protein [Mumia flava]